MKLETAEQIVEHIKTFLKGVSVVGSVYRKEPEVKDIDFVTMKNLKNIYDDLSILYDVKLRVGGDKYLSVIFEIPDDSIQIDFWKADNKEDLKFMKWMRTLEKGKRINYNKKAIKLGLRLTDTGLIDENGEKLNFNILRDLKQFLKQ